MLSSENVLVILKLLFYFEFIFHFFVKKFHSNAYVEHELEHIKMDDSENY